MTNRDVRQHDTIRFSAQSQFTDQRGRRQRRDLASGRGVILERPHLSFACTAKGSQRLKASRFSMPERLDERMKDIE
jgi:hypothetical protein